MSMGADRFCCVIVAFRVRDCFCVLFWGFFFVFSSGEDNSPAASSLIRPLRSIILTEINTAAQLCFSKQRRQTFTSQRVLIGHISQHIKRQSGFSCPVKWQPIKKSSNNWKPLCSGVVFFFKSLNPAAADWELWATSAIRAQNLPSVDKDTWLF